MEWLRIEGGRELRGRVSVPGAKNSCLKLMALCIMASSECTITNVPSITDVDTMCDLLGRWEPVLCASALRFCLSTRGRLHARLPEQLVRCMRASVQVLGPLLARFERGSDAISRRMPHRITSDRSAP